MRSCNTEDLVLNTLLLLETSVFFYGFRPDLPYRQGLIATDDPCFFRHDEVVLVVAGDLLFGD